MFRFSFSFSPASDTEENAMHGKKNKYYECNKKKKLTVKRPIELVYLKINVQFTELR